MAGALARHAVSAGLVALAAPTLPWGTFAVNVSGAWVLGVLLRVLPAATVSAATRAGLTVGFCGGFTTFSTFAHDAVSLAREGEVALAGAYVGGSLVCGILAIAGGLATGAALEGWRRGTPAIHAARPSSGNPTAADQRPSTRVEQGR